MGQLADWAYRKPIVVNHSDDGAQLNYQMPVTLAKGAGVDAPGTIYLNNHSLNWPYDVLFTLSDGVTVVGADFWREEYDVTDGKNWMKANSIPAGGTWNGFIYYGNPGAADASSIANCFGVGLADDFEWGADGDNLSIGSLSGGNITWTDINQGNGVDKIDNAQYFAGSQSALFLATGSSANQGGAQCPHLLTASESLSYRTRITGTCDSVHYFGKDADRMMCIAYTDTAKLQYNPGTGAVDVASGVTLDAWHLIELNNINFAAGTFDIWLDGSKRKTGAGMWVNGTATSKLTFTEYYASCWIDNLIVRNWTANEPTWGDTGPEEKLSSSRKIITFGDIRSKRHRQIFLETLKLK